MDVWIINLIESINHSTGYLVIEWKEEWWVIFKGKSDKKQSRDETVLISKDLSVNFLLTLHHKIDTQASMQLTQPRMGNLHES